MPREMEFMYLVFTHMSDEMYFWWSYCALYLLAHHVRCNFGGVIVPCIYSYARREIPDRGDSGLTM